VTDASLWGPPFAQYRCTVPAASIDYNGHMNDAAYAQVLTEANEVFLDALGMSVDYRERTGCSLYTVEMTIRFLREVGLGDELRAETLLESWDAKRVRVRTTVLAADGTAVATGQSVYLHVDTRAGGVRPIPDDRAAVLAEVQSAHAGALPAR
jgi:acyl-CoA thioester hydrolase